MTIAKSVTLWIDTPVERRVTVDSLKKMWSYPDGDPHRVFHSYANYDKMWKLIRILEDPSQGCRAAVKHRSGTHRWWPCGAGVWANSTYFCYQHRTGDDSRFGESKPWWKLGKK
jgi:hypothetical protein